MLLFEKMRFFVILILFFVNDIGFNYYHEGVGFETYLTTCLELQNKLKLNNS